jgi:hypothetical protein
VKNLQAAGPRDESLIAALSDAERALQPACFLRDHGHEALANGVGILLQEGSNTMLTAFDAEVDEGLLDHVCDFNIKTVVAGGEKFAGMVRSRVQAHGATLRAAVRALRAAAVSKRVSLSLHEVDSLDWLRVLLDAGRSLLMDASSTASEHGVLWLLEAAVGTVHAILWHLAQSGLAEHHDSALFESLLRLSMAVPCLPTVHLDVARAAYRPDEPVPEPKAGTVDEAARAVDTLLLRTLALFWEGHWSTRVSQARA